MFKVKVKNSEKALLFKEEKFIELLDSGVYKIFNLFGKYSLKSYPISLNGISGVEAKNLYREYSDLVEKYFNVVNLDSTQRALILIDGKIEEILGIGEIKLYWKELNLEAIKVDIKESFEIDEKLAKYIDAFATVPKGVKVFNIASFQEGYLYLNKKFNKRLENGKHYYFCDANDIELKLVDKRVKELEINNQELLSKDKVTIRCNATLHYKIVDGLEFLEASEDSYEYIYKQLQFAIREHIGALDIDDILSMQHTIGVEIFNKLKNSLSSVGIELMAINIKDIILPGEMREIFNKVIEATKRAEANNIARREETAAMRSMLNTAKLMKDNPSLARLKELESLEKVVTKVGTLNVYGGLDEVMSGLVKLK